MKERLIRVLDDEDLEFADIMRRLGMQREVATLITYLARAGEATSKEIELATGLRQPEVSEVIRDLRGENMIDVREVKTGGKGRPSLFYTLRTYALGLPNAENPKQMHYNDALIPVPSIFMAIIMHQSHKSHVNCVSPNPNNTHA